MGLKIISADERVESAMRGAVFVLADFDGVHKGHQRLLADAARTASKMGVPLGVISLEPQQASGANANPARLTSRRQQVRALDSLGVEFLCVLPFEARSDAIVRLARDVLADRLGARHVSVDFGTEHRPWLDILTGEGERLGFSASAPEDWGDWSERQSSAAVRAALKAGRTDLATDLLGRPFAIEGVVIEGQKLGRQLGYPTANVAAADYLRPRLGVYATRSRLPDGREVPGVANFGVNPTTGLVDARLEVWLFDFDEDIYGQTLDTDLVTFLRPELKFVDLPALIDKIGEDVQRARTVLFPQIEDLGPAAAVACC